MWVKNCGILFFHCIALTNLLFLTLKAHADDTHSVYQPQLTVLTDDPAFQKYLYELKRTAASSTHLNAKATPDEQAAKRLRIIPLPADTELPTSATNLSQRFIFTRLSNETKRSPTEVAIRESQIEQLRQRALGSEGQ